LDTSTCLLFPNRQIFFINGHVIERVEFIKFLGIIVDSKLNWKMHIDLVSLRIARGLGAIGRVSHILPVSALLMLYHSMIQCHLSHCNILWGSACATALKKLLLWQKRALLIITKSPYYSSANPLFAKLQLLKIDDINRLQTVQFMYDVKHHHLPSSCMRYVIVSDPFRFHFTRNFQFFGLPKFRTVIRENSISIRGPRLWNALPVYIKDSVSPVGLKKSLVHFFCSMYCRTG